jgi:hypothetical protein
VKWFCKAHGNCGSKTKDIWTTIKKGMKWFCRPLGNCGSNCRTRECPTPSPPSLSLSLSLSLFLHSAQPPTVLPSLSGKLGQLTSQLKDQSWVEFIGYFVMRMNGFMKLNLWAFFLGVRCKLCFFCCTKISWTLLVYSSTSSKYLHKGGGKHWELWAGEKRGGWGLLLFCHSISRNELSFWEWIVKVWTSCKR